MRPKPMMPSVLSISSTPEYFERSQRPSTSDACACGMLRASDSSSASVCSAAVTTLDSGALATTTPRFVAAGDVDVVDPDAGAADRPQVRRLGEQVRVDLRGRADQQALVLADALLQLLLGPVGPDVDLEALLAQQLDPRVADLLLHQDLHRASCSTTQSMHAGERPHVVGLDGREHADAQLVATRACGTARCRRCRWRAASRRPRPRRRTRRSRPCRRRASASPGRRRTAWRTSRRLGPAVEVLGGLARARDAPVQPAVGRASTRSGRRAGAASPPRGCCRSGPCASCPAPS